MFNGDTPFSTHSHSDFSPSSEVATTRQTDGAVHKLKLRSFHKSAHLWVHSADFYPSVNCAWRMLGDSLRGINLLQKRRLYRCCALPIALYGFPLWYYNKAPTYYHLNILWKMQQRATLWISGVFWTSPILEIETIFRIIFIHLYLKKLYERFLL